MAMKQMDIVYAHVNYPSHKDIEPLTFKDMEPLYLIRDLLSRYGSVHRVVAHEAEALLRVDLLVIETTIPAVLPVFMAGRAFEIGIPVLQLSKRTLDPLHPGTIPGSTHCGYSSAVDLQKIIKGYLHLHFA